VKIHQKRRALQPSPIDRETGEAIALARKAEIDAHRYVEILTGTLFSAPVYKTYGAKTMSLPVSRWRLVSRT
jgi:3-hydroxyisobutyrate dehydrogenase-like beta-hydroxyacid dehydrogenase